jgi:hypothetical protein
VNKHMVNKWLLSLFLFPKGIRACVNKHMVNKWLLVAVGTALAGRPPHRSRRAALPHRAPALGTDAYQALRIQFSPCYRSVWRCVQNLVCRSGFPLAKPLPSTLSAARGCQPRLCSSLSSVLWACPTSRHRSSRPCSFRILRADRADRAWPTAGPPGFRARCFGACLGSATSPGPDTPRVGGVSGVAFRVRERRRHPDVGSFAAQYPARTFPCQRLPCGLATAQP